MRRRPADPAVVAALAALLGMALSQQAGGAPSSGSYSSYALNATFTKGECPLCTACVWPCPQLGLLSGSLLQRCNEEHAVRIFIFTEAYWMLAVLWMCL